MAPHMARNGAVKGTNGPGSNTVNLCVFGRTSALPSADSACQLIITQQSTQPIVTPCTENFSESLLNSLFPSSEALKTKCVQVYGLFHVLFMFVLTKHTLSIHANVM